VRSFSFNCYAIARSELPSPLSGTTRARIPKACGIVLLRNQDSNTSRYSALATPPSSNFNKTAAPDI
jgi:hypothetical protein